jgi:TolB-like protein
MGGKLIAALLALGFAGIPCASSQTLDQELSTLAQSITKNLVARKVKNVAAVDFTDLRGQPTEWGRFLSDLLTVQMVAIGGVSMVDRANIRSILAEHKLTEEGLVNPANAKKLGEFAGVDAILLGTLTVLGSNVVLTARAISTESATILAAGRSTFPATELQGMDRILPSTGSRAAAASDPSYPKPTSSPALASAQVGPLRVDLKSIIAPELSTSRFRSVPALRCTFEFLNLDPQRPLLVAIVL